MAPSVYSPISGSSWADDDEDDDFDVGAWRSRNAATLHQPIVDGSPATTPSSGINSTEEHEEFDMELQERIISERLQLELVENTPADNHYVIESYDDDFASPSPSPSPEQSHIGNILLPDEAITYNAPAIEHPDPDDSALEEQPLAALYAHGMTDFVGRPAYPEISNDGEYQYYQQRVNYTKNWNVLKYNHFRKARSSTYHHQPSRLNNVWNQDDGDSEAMPIVEADEPVVVSSTPSGSPVAPVAWALDGEEDLSLLVEIANEMPVFEAVALRNQVLRGPATMLNAEIPALTPAYAPGTPVVEAVSQFFADEVSDEEVVGEFDLTFPDLVEDDTVQQRRRLSCLEVDLSTPGFEIEQHGRRFSSPEFDMTFPRLVLEDVDTEQHEDMSPVLLANLGASAPSLLLNEPQQDADEIVETHKTTDEATLSQLEQGQASDEEVEVAVAPTDSSNIRVLDRKDSLVFTKITKDDTKKVELAIKPVTSPVLWVLDGQDDLTFPEMVFSIAEDANVNGDVDLFKSPMHDIQEPKVSMIDAVSTDYAISGSNVSVPNQTLVTDENTPPVNQDKLLRFAKKTLGANNKTRKVDNEKLLLFVDQVFKKEVITSKVRYVATNRYDHAVTIKHENLSKTTNDLIEGNGDATSAWSWSTAISVGIAAAATLSMNALNILGRH